MRWPLVRSTHPNYFTVLVGELLVHSGLALAGLFGDHPSAIWYYLAGGQGRTVGLVATGMAHGVIAALMVAGLYRNWLWMRVALLSSVSVYLLQTSLLVAGIVRSYLDPTVPHVSLESAFYGLGLILLSVAAYREPLVPGRYDKRDEL